MAFAFEKLLVYQKSVDFADQICITTENFPRGYGFLSDQLNRASLSIAANIAEGNGRFTDMGTLHFRSIRKLKRVGDHILIRPIVAAIHSKINGIWP